jgi:DNA-binding transcriptional MerR regulator
VQNADKSASPPGLPEIPNKLVFRIGEVSRLTGVKPHVLRYWETEFPSIAPRKGSTGQRVYRRRDVETVFEIRHLLYDLRFTIEGARKAIESRSESVTKKRNSSSLSDIRRELLSILDLLG